MIPTPDSPVSDMSGPPFRPAMQPDYTLMELLCRPNYRQMCQRQFPLTCPHCGMTFIHQIHLSAHLRVHRPSSRVRCTACSATCSDSLSLQDHVEQAHPSARAFSVNYSLVERISYGPPDAPSGPGECEHAPPSQLNSAAYDVPEDYAYHSAFGECHQRSSAASPITSDDAYAGRSTPGNKVHRPLSTLERLLTQTDAPSPRPSRSLLPEIVVDQPSEELIDVLSTPTDAGRALAEFVSQSRSPSPVSMAYSDRAFGVPALPQTEDCHEYDQSGLLVGKDMSCEHCGKKFLYKCNLARHLSAIHNERTIKTELGSAGKSPRSPFKMGPVAESVPTEKKEVVLLKCQYCERSFTQRSSLVLHQQVHQGPEPYRCGVCHGVRFVTRGQMERHMRRHQARSAMALHRRRRSSVLLRKQADAPNSPDSLYSESPSSPELSVSS